MPRGSTGYRAGLAIAGLLAALALIVRGVLDLRGGGWAMLLVAAAILVALALRRFVFRD